MKSSPLSLADYLAEGLHNSKDKDYNSYLEYVNVNNGLLLFSC